MTAPARDPESLSYSHEEEVEIDLYEVHVLTLARFADHSEWDGTRLLSARLTLVAWQWQGEWHPPSRLAEIIGPRLLPAVERRITERWAETAETNRADCLADQARDARRDTGDYA